MSEAYGTFAGRTVLISGAVGGIGREAVARFGADGATVVAVDVDGAGLAELANETRKAHIPPIVLECDLTDNDAVRSLMGEVVSRTGCVDVLYNNAGGSSVHDGRLHELADAEIRRAISVDLFGTTNLTRAVLGGMVQRQSGAVVNTTSAAALVGLPGCDAYTMAKGAIASLTRSLAAQYAEYGIRVNAVAPGITLTPRVAALVATNPVFAERRRRHLLGFCDPADVVDAAMFLASDRAKKITGVVLPVDSGLTVTGA